LPADHYVTANPLVGRPIVLNFSAFQLWQTFEHPLPVSAAFAQFPSQLQAAITNSVQQMLTWGLLKTEASPGFAPPKHESNTLIAWLHTTDRCNLRCDYCYSPHIHVDMSPETGRGAIDAVFRSALAHGYSRIKLKYAGGEPLLRLALVAALHRYADNLARRYGILLDGVILSNGTLLTPDAVALIRSLGLRLMISLDGLGSFHDRNRSYTAGRGSADDVTRAIDLALNTGLVPEISVTISGRNAEGLPMLVTWLNERNLPFSLNFYRDHDRSGSLTDLQMADDQMLAAMLAAFKAIEADLPNRSLLASLVDRANLSAPHAYPCAVGQDYLVIDPKGRVSKCQMQMDDAVTDITADDPLAQIRGAQTGIQNLSVDEKAECRQCEWRYWCAGGCPLATYRTKGCYNTSSSNCTIYKALYPEVLKLEGLRLLKYASPLQ